MNSTPFSDALVADNIRKIHPYSGGKPIEEVQREYQLDRVIKLASNECPMPASRQVLDAINNCVQTLSEYPDGNGYYLKQALAQRHQLAPENITLGSGSSEILSLLVTCFCQQQRGDTLLFPQYSFLVYSLLAQTFNIGFRQTAVHGWSTDLDALRDGIDNNTRIIFIASPANPLGTHLDNDSLYNFIKSIRSDIIVVLDQAYADFVPDIDDTIAWLDQFPYLVITRTFSKAYGLAGLRIGYGLASSDITDFINRIRPPFNTSSLAQAAALAALEDQQSLQITLDNNATQMARLGQWFTAKGIEWIPSQANFISFRSPIDTNTLYQQLLRQGLIIRPLANYGMAEYLRVTIGTADDMDTFYRIMDNVLATA